jgi:hypothetical protein
MRPGTTRRWTPHDATVQWSAARVRHVRQDRFMGFLKRLLASTAAAPDAPARSAVTDGLNAASEASATAQRRARRSAPTPGRGRELLAAARVAHDRAEQTMSRSPQTTDRLERGYLAAAQALTAEGDKEQLSAAWLGVAVVRRYVKGRRGDTLDAFEEALSAAPEDDRVWEAYLDYVTYGVTAADLLAIVARMSEPVRTRHLSGIVTVSRGFDRWGTMAPLEREEFTVRLPLLLAELGDDANLGALLSEQGLRERRDGSHAVARDLMRRAVATGYAPLACVDRLTLDLIQLGEYGEAAAILTAALQRPIPSDSLRGRMVKRLAKCTRNAGAAVAPGGPR